MKIKEGIKMISMHPHVVLIKPPSPPPPTPLPLQGQKDGAM